MKLQRLTAGFVIFFVVVFTASSVFGMSSCYEGERVHYVDGYKSDAKVLSGYVINTRSNHEECLIRWDNQGTAFNPGEPWWIYASSLYDNYSDASSERSERDSSHTSLGEAAGAAAIGGLIYMLLNSD